MFSHAVGHVADDILRGVELGLLGEVANREPWREASLSGEAIVETGHDAQQRGLS